MLFFLRRIDKIFHIQYEHEISAELLPNKVIDSFFSSEYNFVSAQGKYHRTYYLNKCRMDIYPALHFMWKWARSKRGFFLSFCTTLIIVMHAMFKTNAIVSECTGVFYNVHPTYLFHIGQPSNNPHSRKHRSWESRFSFLNKWKFGFLKVCYFIYEKEFFNENTNTFETRPPLD